MSDLVERVARALHKELGWDEADIYGDPAWSLLATEAEVVIDLVLEEAARSVEQMHEVNAKRIAALEVALRSMDDTIVSRSELFVSDQECLFNLRDRIRLALKQEKPE